MERIKNKYFCKSRLILAVFLAVFAMLIVAFALQSAASKAYASSGIVNGGEEKCFSTASINEDFVDDTVIVVLSQETSLKFLSYAPNDFPELYLKDVESINENATGIVQNQVSAEKAGNTSARNKIVDNDVYRRTLALRLQDKGKENVLAAIKLLEKRADVISASPDYIMKLRSLPNDKSFTDPAFIAANGMQWGLNGTSGSVKADAAWNYTIGSSEVIVGVIDTGIRALHEDLTNRVDYGLSRDFTLKNPAGHVPTDDDGHGTRVAGIIGAQGNNNRGISGVCWNVTLVQLKVSMSKYPTGGAEIAQAIDYATGTFATDRPIRIINFSGGNEYENTAVKQALLNYPGLFICSVDNENVNHDTKLDYPTEYSRDVDFKLHRDNVISVGSINKLGNKSSFSAYGSNSVSIFAPGEDILSTTCANDSAYDIDEGTSFAAPHVAGVAALMLSENPNLTPAYIKSIIITQAQYVSALNDLCVADGQLDAFAAVDYARSVGTSFDYEVTSGTKVSVKAKPGAVFSDELVIPDTTVIGNTTYTVTKIAENGFVGQNISSVTIPNTVTAIGASAFEGCTSLGSGGQTLYIPDSVKIIGEKAFKDCIDLKRTEILGNTTNIDSFAFQGCNSMQVVTLTGGDQSLCIGGYAFEGCAGLTSIDIPSNVTSIDCNAFQGCVGLVFVSFAEGSQLTCIGNNAFANCMGLMSIIIPSNVTNIDSEAFKDCVSIVSLTFRRITQPLFIGRSAFQGCTSLTNVILSDNVTYIDEKAFYGCTNLTYVVIPSSVVSAGNSSFENCTSLSTVTVERASSQGVTTLGTNAFRNCPLTNIYVPNNSVTAYKSAANWSEYSDKILATQSFEITFNANGGSYCEPISGVYGQTITLPYSSRPRYTGVWGNGLKFQSSYVITENETLTATWTFSGGIGGPIILEEEPEDPDNIFPVEPITIQDNFFPIVIPKANSLTLLFDRVK